MQVGQVYTSEFDPSLKVAVIAATANPQQVAYLALHQCYSSGEVYSGQIPPESKCGELAIKNLLAGGRGHFSCLEHNSISFNVVGFPHSAVQQLRTHRVGVSYSVQSGRYTGAQILDLAAGNLLSDDVVYLRPVGEYRDREGNRYTYSAADRAADMERVTNSAEWYFDKAQAGYSAEHARAMFPFDIRQNFVFTANLRSLWHVCDLRFKLDAQLEIREMAGLFLKAASDWCPELNEWYMAKRAGKAMLAP